jgi:aspartate dehydrogenase
MSLGAVPTIAAARFAIIGYGAITEEIVSVLAASGDFRSLTGVLVRPGRILPGRERAAGRFPVTDSVDALLAAKPDCVIECAGHGAVREYGPNVVSRGVDLVIAAVGAIADGALATTLLQAARPPARVLIPSGAVAGIDGLLAARTAGLSAVTYTSIKPPIAWIGTPAEPLLAGDGGKHYTVFFEGTAREAATKYPKNANVGATVALASHCDLSGLDRTTVKLVSDPAASGPLGIIEASGAFGTFRFEILAYASPTNPKTSALTAHSLLCAAEVGYAFPITR